MLTSQIAQIFWSRYSATPKGFVKANLPLVARSALIIYRRHGKAEATTFIQLIRTLIAADELLPDL